MSFYYFEDGDMLLVVGNTTHKVHRALLSIHSMVFWEPPDEVEGVYTVRNKQMEVMKLLNMSELEVEYYLDAVYSPMVYVVPLSEIA